MSALKNNRLVLATTNTGKVREMKSLLPGVEVLTLTDVSFTDDVEEPFETFAGNARAKAGAVFAATGIAALADDSGLCVEALGGAPGVHSARYAGVPQDSAKNIAKLLEAMRGVENRRAYFAAALCLCDENGARIFEGQCSGTIAHKPSGEGGFGYDPVFIPDGFAESFGVLPQDAKARLSHRAKALQKLATAVGLAGTVL